MIKHLGGAKSGVARMQIEDFGAALDLYYLDNGRYPSSEEGLSALISPPGDTGEWNGPYLKKKNIPEDAWGNEYHYDSPGQNGPYDLYSYGADKASGGDGEGKDIVSWE